MGSGHLGVAPVNLFVLILLFGFVRLVFRLTFSQRPSPGQPKLKAPRPLKPKSGADCPFCRAEQLARQSHHHEEDPRLLPLPWRSTRSPRGRRKAIRTEGFACHDLVCPYYGITDQRRHALVADGTHTCTGAVPKGPARCQCGKHERIQDLRCQACGHKFSFRRQTVL